MLDPLLDQFRADPYVTFYAVNAAGNMITNNGTADEEGTNTATAVTWGVFPGQEIVQPTIVEHDSFLAWKDEAFALWRMWGDIYPAESASRKLIAGIAREWYLVNVVDNDYRDGNARIFDVFA